MARTQLTYQQLELLYKISIIDEISQEFGVLQTQFLTSLNQQNINKLIQIVKNTSFDISLVGALYSNESFTLNPKDHKKYLTLIKKYEPQRIRNKCVELFYEHSSLSTNERIELFRKDIQTKGIDNSKLKEVLAKSENKDLNSRLQDIDTLSYDKSLKDKLKGHIQEKNKQFTDNNIFFEEVIRSLKIQDEENPEDLFEDYIKDEDIRVAKTITENKDAIWDVLTKEHKNLQNFATLFPMFNDNDFDEALTKTLSSFSLNSQEKRNIVNAFKEAIKVKDATADTLIETLKNQKKLKIQSIISAQNNKNFSKEQIKELYIGKTSEVTLPANLSTFIEESFISDLSKIFEKHEKEKSIQEAEKLCKSYGYDKAQTQILVKSFWEQDKYIRMDIHIDLFKKALEKENIELSADIINGIKDIHYNSDNNISDDTKEEKVKELLQSITNKERIIQIFKNTENELLFIEEPLHYVDKKLQNIYSQAYEREQKSKVEAFQIAMQKEKIYLKEDTINSLKDSFNDIRGNDEVMSEANQDKFKEAAGKIIQQELPQSQQNILNDKDKIIDTFLEKVNKPHKKTIDSNVLKEAFRKAKGERTAFSKILNNSSFSLKVTNIIKQFLYQLDKLWCKLTDRKPSINHFQVQVLNARIKKQVKKNTKESQKYR